MARQASILVRAIAALSCLLSLARGQGDGVRAEPGSWGAAVETVANPAPTQKATYKGVLIRYPDGADSWLNEVKAAIDTTAAELALFGIKLAPNMTVYLTGSHDEYAKVVGNANASSSGWWTSAPDRLVAYRGPTTRGGLVSDVANAVAGLSALTHQRPPEKAIPEWLLRGLQSRALLANAARVVGVPEVETELYRFLVSRLLDAVERENRATGLEILADKVRRSTSAATEVDLPPSLLHGLLPIIMPLPSEKGNMAKHKAFCDLVGALVKSEAESRELDPQELRGVARQFVQALKIEEWFKEASKDSGVKQQLASMGIDIDSPAFKAAMKDTELELKGDSKKPGKNDAKVPEPGSPEARFNGGRYAALFEAYAVYQTHLRGEQVKASRARAGEDPSDSGAGNGGGARGGTEKDESGIGG